MATTKKTAAKPAAKAAAKPAAKSAEDWRADALNTVRALINEAIPGVAETRKWAKASNNMQGVPVWESDGIICTGETYKAYVKLTFAKGASLADPSGLFNADDKGATRRAIDIREGDTLNAKAFKALVKEAAKLNAAGKK